MKHSTDRILTTHAGRLDGPPDYQEMMRSLMSAGTSSGTAGAAVDVSTIRPRVRSAITDVIRKQANAGIDVISDGELGKMGFGGIGYYGRRLSGLTTRKLKPGESAFMALQTGERLEFADFYKDLPFMASPTERAICSSPISYIGQEEVKQDLADFRTALAEANVQPEETFMCVLAPGWLEHFFHNEYYSNDEAYLFALADAVNHEYKTVVDS
jgi:5-methyltetrahydropteroyltriglutamate--homocysteine methyltransferase